MEVVAGAALFSEFLRRRRLSQTGLVTTVFRALSLVISSVLGVYSWPLLYMAVGVLQETGPDPVSRHSLGFLPILGRLRLVYVRDIPREVIPQYDSEMTPEECRNVMQDLNSAKSRDAILAILAVLTMGGLFIGPLPTLMLGGMAVFLFLGKPYEDEYMESDPAGMADGIYRVVEDLHFFSIVRGVAYAQAGSVMSRYHVTGHSDIYLDELKLRPCYVSRERDFIAWGAHPVVEVPKDGDEVVAMVLHPERDVIVPIHSRCSIIGGEVMSKMLRTVPGTSGSPLFVLREVDGEKLMLYTGAIGRNIQRDTQYQYEVQSHMPVRSFPMESAITPGTVLQLFAPPGSGKTVGLPDHVSQMMSFSDAVIVAGPTRVVANELLEALKGFQGVGCWIKGKPRANRSCRVIVTTHQTLLRYYLTTELSSRRNVSYIVDETHVDNSQTRLLLSLLRVSLEDKRHRGALLEMTATGYDQAKETHRLERGSNYAIVDKQVDDIVGEATTYMQQHPNARVAIFVPKTVGKGASGQNIYDQLKVLGLQQTLVLMSRQTYSIAKMAINKVEGPICIITTTISECGANYNLDAVFDLCSQLRYVCTNGGIVSQTTPITRSQMIQRRGRVGRRREGLYVYPSSVDEENLGEIDHPESSTTLETGLLLRAFGLGTDGPPDPQARRIYDKVVITREQAVNWITEGRESEPLMSAYIRYTPEGRPRGPTARKQIHNYLKDNKAEDARVIVRNVVNLTPAEAAAGEYDRDDELMPEGMAFGIPVRRKKITSLKITTNFLRTSYVPMSFQDKLQESIKRVTGAFDDDSDVEEEDTEQ